jgi:hypothetical protein
VLNDKAISVIIWPTNPPCLCGCEDRVVQRFLGLTRMTFGGSGRLPKSLYVDYADNIDKPSSSDKWQLYAMLKVPGSEM